MSESQAKFIAIVDCNNVCFVGFYNNKEHYDWVTKNNALPMREIYNEFGGQDVTKEDISGHPATENVDQYFFYDEEVKTKFYAD